MTAKHLLSEIVAGLDGVSTPDDIAKVAQAITERFATWLLLHEREELAAEIGKALIAARRQAFDEAAQKARRWAAHYPHSSDGRNTFTLFAEWADDQAPQCRASAHPHSETRQEQR